MSPHDDVLAGLHACLVTPGHPSTNPRLVKEADALVACGARVTVVHGRFLPWADESDRRFAARGWRTVVVPFGPLAGRATWLRQGLARRGAALLAAVQGDVGHDARAFHPAAADLARAARAVPADVFLGHNLAGGLAAAEAAERRGVPLGFDAEDDHVGELPDAPAHRAERRRRDALLRHLLPRCAHLTAASPRIAATLAREYGVSAVTVLNVFPRRDAQGLPGPAPADARSLYWVSQTLGPGRGLEPVVDALARVPGEWRLVLRGRPLEGYPAALRGRLAASGGDPSRLEFLPPIAADRVTASAHGHALGLSTEVADCRNHEDCLGNKIFHYLLAGTPVLLSDTPAQRELAAELGAAALLVDLRDPVALAARLAAWLGDAALRARAADTAWRLARERWCWDVAQSRFLASLRAALARRRAAPA